MDTSRSVTVLAHGGLGNQLFQYAAAVSLDSSPHVLSYGGGWGSGHPTLADFGIPVKYPNRVDRSRVPGIELRETWKDAVSAEVAKAWGKVRGVEVITQAHPFTPRPDHVHSTHLVLNGYFQHPSWWNNSWRTVATQIADRAPREVLEARGSGPAVVKIRRSDYLDLGWALSADWLVRAFQALGLVDRDVIVLAEDSDGRDFALPIVREFGCSVVAAPRFVADPDLNDFWTLAHAQVIVCANSSFSWWGAAVAEVLGGAHVGYPNPWLPNQWADEPLPDLGLPHWLPVPVTSFNG